MQKAESASAFRTPGEAAHLSKFSVASVQIIFPVGSRIVQINAVLWQKEKITVF